MVMKRSNTAEEELQNVTVQLARTQNEMMNTLAQNQIQLQENNMVMMTDLLSSHYNLYVLADIEVYNGKTVKLEDWLLQVEKASELTKIEPYEIVFAKSHSSPHKIIKTMGPGKSWNAVKTISKRGYVNHIASQSEGDSMSEGLISDITPMESEMQTPPDCAISSSEDDLMDSEVE